MQSPFDEFSTGATGVLVSAGSKLQTWGFSRIKGPALVGPYNTWRNGIRSRGSDLKAVAALGRRVLGGEGRVQVRGAKLFWTAGGCRVP